MNQTLLTFFNKHYAPGRIGLVGASDSVGKIIRAGQSRLTPDQKPSRWSHAFLMGHRRDDGRTDGSIYIFESDLQIDTKNWRILNGAMESRIMKWCRDDIEHACVLAINSSINGSEMLVRTGLEFAYDEERVRYPLGKLFGTWYAILTGTTRKRNIFDKNHAIQCATFVRMCYQSMNEDFIINGSHQSNTSPEEIFQSQKFTVREVWTRSK